MWLNLIQNKISITFQYHPRIVNAVKTVTGRSWNAPMKRWECPIENADEAVRILTPLGFTASAEVRALVDEILQETKIADDIKNGPTPEITSRFPLFDFQKKGTVFIQKMKGVLLGDSMGLGKSLQTLAALDCDSGPHLIICPKSLLFSWKAEISKWAPDDKVIVIDGDKETRKTQWFYAKTSKYTVANYELLLHDTPFISTTEWKTITCDESTRISNPEAKTTQILKTLKCGKKIALTGTPVANSPVDIFSAIDWLAPRYLGSFAQFKEKYCVTDPFGSVITYKNLDHLAGKVNRFMIRRSKEEVFDDFPKMTISKVLFDLSPEERKTYNGIKELIRAEIMKLDLDNPSSIVMIPVKMLRLLQMTDDAKLLQPEWKDERSKLEALKDILKPIMKSLD